MVFVQDFLVPAILNKPWKPQFGGALILDSIMNYNNSAGSQDVLQEWHRQVQQAAVDITQNKGDNTRFNFFRFTWLE